MAFDSQLPPAPAPISGNQPLLVIFADFTPSMRVGSTAATLASKFFGSTNSVKHFYETISYSKFSLTPAPETNVALSGLVNDGVVSVTLNYPHPDTAITIDDRNRSIVRDALIAADPFVDFSQFDENGDGTIAPTELHIVVIAAGYERSFTASPCGSSVWGHRWGLFGNVAMPTLDGTAVGQSYSQFGEWHCADSNGPGNAATVGVMVHELGHDLGLPDLYDIDGSSEGIGNWSLMATGSWNQVELAGDAPAHMDPWSKYFLGWINPTAVTATLSNESISASATSGDVYRLLPGTPLAGEYFLVENRQQVNYDAGLPGAGLLIWHIDTAKRTSNNRDNTHECYPNGPSCAADHYLVALVQADNAFDLEQGYNRGDGGDPWPGTSGKTTFNGSSNPSSDLYNGSAGGVSISAIGSPGTVMTATLSVLGAIPTVTIVATDNPATEEGVTAGTFTVTRAGAGTGSALTVLYQTAGSATNGTDYQILTGSVTIAAGQSSAGITVTPIDDEIVGEGNETVIVQLQASAAYNLGTAKSATVTIVDKIPPVGSLQFSAASYSVNEAGENAAIAITRTGGSYGAISAAVTTSNGTATAGSDYTATTWIVSFADGDTASKTVSIPIGNDTFFESDETVNLTLTNPSGGASLGSPDAAVLTIIDDDPAPAVSISGVQLIEGNSGTINAVFAVTLSPASNQTVMVSYHTADNTAQAGSDYVAKASSLTFNPGETAKNITVVVNGDTIPEANETFLVILSGATNARVADNQGLATIVNDDLVKATWHFDADFDGDGRADIAVYRDGMWFITRSSDGGITTVGWGGALQDVPVPADYDGDGKADITVYRDGVWFILRSSDGGVTGVGWGGLLQDIPVPADYDGDGKTDIAIYRDGGWYIIRSSDGGFTGVGWGGLPQDSPLPGDYDGDGKTDMAVYRDGGWYIIRSSDGGVTGVGWGGLLQDIPVPADYDGDGKTDIAVYRDGGWYIIRSSDGGITGIGWGGLLQDIPVPGDYDGDGKTDIAVYRDGGWFIIRSSDGALSGASWGGQPQDIPLN
jgi:M6 family metalloprotease-like protein